MSYIILTHYHAQKITEKWRTAEHPNQRKKEQVKEQNLVWQHNCEYHLQSPQQQLVKLLLGEADIEPSSCGPPIPYPCMEVKGISYQEEM